MDSLPIGVGNLDRIVGSEILGGHDLKGIANQIVELLVFVIHHNGMNPVDTLRSLILQGFYPQSHCDQAKQDKERQGGTENFLFDRHGAPLAFLRYFVEPHGVTYAELLRQAFNPEGSLAG